MGGGGEKERRGRARGEERWGVQREREREGEVERREGDKDGECKGERGRGGWKTEMIQIEKIKIREWMI